MNPFESEVPQRQETPELIAAKKYIDQSKQIIRDVENGSFDVNLIERLRRQRANGEVRELQRAAMNELHSQIVIYGMSHDRAQKIAGLFGIDVRILGLDAEYTAAHSLKNGHKDQAVSIAEDWGIPFSRVEEKLEEMNAEEGAGSVSEAMQRVQALRDKRATRKTSST